MTGGTAQQSLGGEIPPVSAGLTLLRTDTHRPTALHRMALQMVRDVDGIAYWVDARNTASTYALHEFADHDRLLRRIRLARAFTAYQHSTLAKRLVNTVTPRTGCIVAPNVASLYRDDDVPDHEAPTDAQERYGRARDGLRDVRYPSLDDGSRRRRTDRHRRGPRRR